MISTRKPNAFVLAWLIAAAALFGAVPAPAEPVQVVNVCGSDDAPGGLNLSTALATGGEITVRCPAGQNEIAFTQTQNLGTGVAITGDGDVTLRGPSSGAMFTTAHRLRISKLKVVNSAAVAGSVVSGDQANVELDTVVVEGSPSAFLVRSLKAVGSRFANNGDAAAEASGSSVVNAETVDIRGSEFVGNGDHPIAGGAWPAPGRVPLSRSVTIEDTTFTDNRHSLLLIDAQVAIRASRFINNGRPPDTARGAWGCCGGAITMVRSDVVIRDSDFQGNGSSGFGGAIHSIASRLTVERSTFEENQARVGGAIMSWARPPLVNIWSVDDWTDLPRLVLSSVTFGGNEAAGHGGAIAFAGPVLGNGLVVRGNQAQTAGGAIASWNGAALPDPYGGVLPALVDNTKPQVDALTLTRSVLVENRSGESGAALALADAESAIGNTIIARNETAAGAAVTGSVVRLANVVVADNKSVGIESPTGAAVSLGNSIVLNNVGNCAFSSPPALFGPNMQHPGDDCGSDIQSTDPGLDGKYAPGLVSAARDAGDFGLCVSDPTVAGVDLDGRTRIGAEKTCAIGAIERSVLDSVAAALTFNTQQEFGQCLVWILVLLLLVAAIIGFILGRRRRRRRTT